jgi:uncharacterized membrane protein
MPDNTGAETKAESAVPSELLPDAAESSDDSKNVIIFPPETVQRAAESGQSLSLTIQTAHAGPLPSPRTLKAYEDVYPGLPKIIIDQFQAEARHRRRLQTISQFGALGIALLSIILGTVLAYALGNWAAAVAVIGPVCGAIGTAQLLQYWLKS